MSRPVNKNLRGVSPRGKYTQMRTVSSNTLHCQHVLAAQTLIEGTLIKLLTAGACWAMLRAQQDILPGTFLPDRPFSEMALTVCAACYDVVKFIALRVP